MKLTVVAVGVTENEKRLEVGDEVIYVSHIPGGMVKIKLPNGEIDVAHPGCFKELR